MNQKELKELIEFLIEKDIAEFELERGDVKVRIKRAQPQNAAQMLPAVTHVAPAVTLAPVVGPSAQAVVAHPHPHTPSAPPAGRPAAEEEGLHTIQSPIVGTFYDAPSPGAPPFVKVGDTVANGQVLCIIEAMKLMNEIESDVGGEIVKKLVNNGQPVEYGQALFAIRPR
jgi:acetyl-CoA carboxylase biotin carboxyl carrier protein